MVKFLCTTESCLKLGENGVYADRVCVELLAACVKIDRNTSIPQSPLATIHTGEEKKHKPLPRNLRSLAGDRGLSACLHSVQWNVLGKFGQVGKQAKLLWTLGEMDPN